MDRAQKSTPRSLPRSCLDSTESLANLLGRVTAVEWPWTARIKFVFGRAPAKLDRTEINPRLGSLGSKAWRSSAEGKRRGWR